MTEATAILNAPLHQTKWSRGQLKNNWMELSFLPEFGCHWTRLRLALKGEWVDFLKPVGNGDVLLDAPTGHGSYILAPWSNRIPGGNFQHDGKSYNVRTNFPDGSAIHGDVRTRPWKVNESDASHFDASLDTSDFEDFNFPFALRFHHTMEILGNHLKVKMVTENIDKIRAPVGVGYHPYFLRRLTWRDDDVILQVPAEKVYPANECLPTGEPVPVEGRTDLRSLRKLGAPNLDHCYTDFTENQFRIIYPGSRVQVRFEFDETFSHAVVYAPNITEDSAVSSTTPAPYFALEPVTHTNNGFNLEEKGWKNTGVKLLEPGEIWETSWSISAGDI